DLRLVALERFRDGLEARREGLVLALIRKRPRPVHREIEMAAAIIAPAEPDRRRLVALENRADPLTQRFGPHHRARVAGLLAEILDRDREREELPERVPAQIVLLQELLHVLRRGAARAG